MTEGWYADTVLAPDITTERDPGTPTMSGYAGTPRTPETRPAVAEPRNPVAPHDTSIVEARHPEIARAISLLWGFPEMNEYFDRLWLADGEQGPIDPDAMSELMLLARVHQSIVPQRPGRSLAALYGGNRVNDANSRPQNPWNDVPPRR